MEPLLTKVSLLLAIALQVFILRLLIKRKLQQRFLWFLCYIVYALIEEVLRISVSGNIILYTRVYWWTEIGDLLLSVMAVRESFLNMFRPYTRLRSFLLLIWSSVGVALLYAGFRAAFFPPFHATRQAAIVIGLETAVDYSLAAVGILYFALLSFFRIRERRWEIGIVSGFTINAIFAVLGVLIISIFRKKFSLLSEWIPAVAYIIAELEWAVSLSRPEIVAHQVLPKVTAEDLRTLERYKETLQKFLGRKP